MNTRRRYTIEEVRIVHKHLCNYPSNYTEGFKKAALELGNRNYKSIMTSFYTSPIFKQFFLENPIQGLHSNTTLVEVNRKNCPNIEGKTHPDLFQINNTEMGVQRQSNNTTVIRMQNAQFQIGNIIITGTNIEVQSFT